MQPTSSTRPGRPTVWTPETEARLFDGYRELGTHAAAAALAGVARSTVRSRILRDDDFAEAVDLAQGEYIVRRQRQVERDRSTRTALRMLRIVCGPDSEYNEKLPAAQHPAYVAENAFLDAPQSSIPASDKDIRQAEFPPLPASPASRPVGRAIVPSASPAPAAPAPVNQPRAARPVRDTAARECLDALLAGKHPSQVAQNAVWAPHSPHNNFQKKNLGKSDFSPAIATPHSPSAPRDRKMPTTTPKPEETTIAPPQWMASYCY